MTATIAAALDDPALFGPLLAGDSWRAWRAFFASLFALPLDHDALALYRHHTGRTTPPDHPFREAALVIGRRGGKSRVLAITAVALATLSDYAPHLAPGEVPVIAIIAADRRQARVLLRYVIGTLRAVPLLASMIEGEPVAEAVRLSNGVVVEIHTGSIASPRGRTFVAVLADELAFWRSDDSSSNPDNEVLASIRPGLISIPSSILLLASSPYAKRGVLYETFKRHWGHDDARVLVWRGTTAEMNPTIDPEAIREAFEADPAAARAEYGAEFRDDIANFLPRELIEAAIDRGVTVRPPLPGTKYTAFCDASGGVSDSFTAAIAHNENGVAVLDAIFERRAPFDPAAVVRDITAMLREYRAGAVSGDRYAGRWVAEAFEAAGVEYHASARDRSVIYLDVLPMFTSGKLRLLDNARMASQFTGLERRTGTGRDQIDHGPGGHDDIANSVAGALTAAARPVDTAAIAMPLIIRGPRTSLVDGGGPEQQAWNSSHGIAGRDWSGGNRDDWSNRN